MAEIKEKLTGNVVCYGRVSTTHDEQAESLENQQILFNNFLDKNKELINVGTFLDKESGKTSERKEYLGMVSRVAQGDIRFILAKNASRLSRSTEVSGALNRLCERYNCKIIFVGTGEVYDPKNRSDRLTNTIMSAIAEDYIYNQSELGKQAHLLKCSEKRLNRQNETFGYRFNTKINQMEIVEEEAAIVRLIFEWYVYKDMGISQIARELAAIGVVGKRSGKVLTARTLLQRLKDTAYIGKMAFNKSESHIVTGVGAKTTRTKRPQEEWVYADCPAIISDELFYLAQVIRTERKHLFKADKGSDPQARFTGTHLFSAKVFCGNCGKSYQHFYCDRKKSISAYRDSFSRKAHLPDEVCENQSYNKIFEQQLAEVCLVAINSIIENHKKIFDNAIDMIRDVLLSENKEDNNELHNRLKKTEEEKQNWLHAYKDAVVSGDELLKEECLICFKEAASKAEKLQEILRCDAEKEKNAEAIEERIKDIEKRVNELKRLDTLTREDVLLFIDKIIIQDNGQIEIYLAIGEKVAYKIKPYNEYRENLVNKGSLFILGDFSFVEIITDDEKYRIIESIKNDDRLYISVFNFSIVCENAFVSGKSHSLFMREKNVKLVAIAYIKI